MRVILALAAVAVLAGPAAAQSTHCRPDGIGGVDCETSQPPNFNALASQIGQIAANRRAAKAAAPLFVQALSDRRCDDAMALAVQFGNANDQALVRQCFSDQAAIRRNAQVDAQIAAERQKQETDTWMGGIVTAIKEGRCDDAKASALGANRLDVADQVVRVCTPSKPSAAPILPPAAVDAKRVAKATATNRR